MQFKLRSCIGGTVGVDPECPEDEQTMSKQCNTQPCPRYKQWVYEECSVTCGGGIQKGTRECETFGVAGALCVGPSTTTRTCKTQQCPRWGGYTSWSSCPVTCGGGRQTRTRNCLGGNVGDIGCHVGTAVDTRDCNTKPCPRWGDWVANGGCSVTCGTGVQYFTRTCVNGIVGQRGCLGSSSKSSSCNKGSCAYWGSWNAWGRCSVTCGQGRQIRTRTCIGGTAGEGRCTGSSTAAQVCTKPSCTTPAPTPANCNGKIDRVNTDTCKRYQAKNYCGIYKSWMSNYCAKTCCVTPCKIEPDQNSYCAIYYSRSPNYCNIEQFLRSCNTSCKRCE